MQRSTKSAIHEIKSLWNHEPYIKKYKDTKYTYKNPEVEHMSRRLRTVHKLLNNHVKKNSKILELGLGAGQSAQKFLKEGYDYTGVDISSSLIKFAIEKNKNYIKKKKAKFLVGSMDNNLPFENETFDSVIIIGALQYVVNIDNCLKEIKRVMKNDAVFIVAQTNSFGISELTTFNRIIQFITRVIFKENFMYSYSNTFKSIICETTRLKKKLNISGNEKWLKSKFLNFGDYLPWSFKGKRRIFSYDRLSNLLKKKNLKCIEYSYGGVFFYKKKLKIFNFLFSAINLILNIFYKFMFLNFILKRIGSSIIFVSKK